MSRDRLIAHAHVHPTSMREVLKRGTLGEVTTVWSDVALPSLLMLTSEQGDMAFITCGRVASMSSPLLHGPLYRNKVDGDDLRLDVRDCDPVGGGGR